MMFEKHRGFIVNRACRTLTDEQVVQLRQERADGVTLRKLEVKWGINKTAISRICRGTTYMEVGGPRTFGREW